MINVKFFAVPQLPFINHLLFRLKASFHVSDYPIISCFTFTPIISCFTLTPIFSCFSLSHHFLFHFHTHHLLFHLHTPSFLCFTFAPIISCFSLTHQTVALKEIQLKEEEGAPFTAIREGTECSNGCKKL